MPSPGAGDGRGMHPRILQPLERAKKNLSRPGTIKLAEEYTLPSAQLQPSALNGNHFGSTDQTRFDVGRGIALQVPIRRFPGHDLVQHHDDQRLR